MYRSPLYDKLLVVTTIILACIAVFCMCVERSKESTPGLGKTGADQFVGSEKCRGCHAGIYESYIKTSHFFTSIPADSNTVKGSLEKGHNSFVYNDHVVVSIEKRDSGIFQVAYLDKVEKLARRIDIVFGSGTKGQTYLSWYHDALFQLPVSFFTPAKQWANSPGLPGQPVFSRPVTSRCMECHATFAKYDTALVKGQTIFDMGTLTLGIQCEKCHGPGAAHVALEAEKKSAEGAHHIIDPASFTRQQKLDMCALCHAGRMDKLQPSFSFVAGDSLSRFMKPNEMIKMIPNFANTEVHGNQLGLLQNSKCFAMTSTLTCVTCHNPHENERGNVASFSKKCVTCHDPGKDKFCSMSKTLGASIVNNCIDCHMPLQPSMSIALQLSGNAEPTAALIRSHTIGIYKDVADQFLKKYKPGMQKK